MACGDQWSVSRVAFILGLVPSRLIRQMLVKKGATRILDEHEGKFVTVANRDVLVSSFPFGDE